MKIWVVNGAHSALAYICQFAGIEYVAAGMVDPSIAQFIERLQEVESGKSIVAPIDRDAIFYGRSFRKCASNAVLLHKSIQIAMDGSQKLPQRTFAPANDLVKLELPTKAITLVIAAWIGFLEVNQIVDDPLAVPLQRYVRNCDCLASASGVLTLKALATKVDSNWFPQIAKWLEVLWAKPVVEGIRSCWTL